MMELGEEGDNDCEMLVLEKLANGMKMIFRQCGCTRSFGDCTHEAGNRNVSPVKKASLESIKF